MDVAIDALAVSVLKEDERGVANGMMFAGAYVGNGLGGAGVLFLTHLVPFNMTFIVVGGAIVGVALFVALVIREPRAVLSLPAEEEGATRAERALAELYRYVITALRAI